MKKTILAAIRLPAVLFGFVQRIFFVSKRGQEQGIERAQEEERLDRIRNPRNYGPGKED